jgi:hypothetical protein
VLAVGVWVSRQRIGRSQVAVALGALACWGLLILAAPSLIAIAGG